jgi:hypothetical protein
VLVVQIDQKIAAVGREGRKGSVARLGREPVQAGIEVVRPSVLT